MTIESVILTWCNETDNFFSSDSRVAITCFHASSMGNHQLQIVDSRIIGMSRVFYVDGRVDLGGFGSVRLGTVNLSEILVCL